MLKDIYAKKPQYAAAAAAVGTAQGAIAPFTLICSLTSNASKAPNETSLEERIAQLTQTLYGIDLDGKPVWKPFKPFITQPRRFRGGFDKEPNGWGRHFNHLMDGHFHKIVAEDTKQIEDASDLEDHLESLTKVLIPNILEYQAGHSTKTKFDALNARNLATCRKTVRN